MQKNNKKGVTLISLVVYISLFTVFIAFATSVSNGINERLFDARGQAINHTNLNKLEYNILSSEKESNSVELSGKTITYSNGDVYNFDESKGAILKNGGVLCSNVESFEATIEKNDIANKISMNVTFNKYLNVLTRQVISCVEVM